MLIGDLVVLPIHNLYRHVSTIHVQIQFPSMNFFQHILFMNSLSQIFFYKFNITNSFSRLIWGFEVLEKVCMNSHDFVLVRFCEIRVLSCEWPVLYKLSLKGKLRSKKN